MLLEAWAARLEEVEKRGGCVYLEMGRRCGCGCWKEGRSIVNGSAEMFAEDTHERSGRYLGKQGSVLAPCTWQCGGRKLGTENTCRGRCLYRRRRKAVPVHRPDHGAARARKPGTKKARTSPVEGASTSPPPKVERHHV